MSWCIFRDNETGSTFVSIHVPQSKKVRCVETYSFAIFNKELPHRRHWFGYITLCVITTQDVIFGQPTTAWRSFILITTRHQQRSGHSVEQRLK